MLAACLLSFALQDGGYDVARSHWEAGRYREALVALEDEEDPLLGHQGRAHVRYLARDFPAALDEARAGLALAPGDPVLLHRALTAAIWLRYGALAQELAEELAAAVDAGAVEATARAWWLREIDDLRARADALADARKRRDAALGRSRLVACILIVATGAAIVFLGYGRSSRPVP